MEDMLEENIYTENAPNTNGDLYVQNNKIKTDRHVAEPIFKDNNLSGRTKKYSYQHKCDQCHMAFGSRRNLERHIPRAHIKPVSCERCKSVFAGKHSFQKHYQDCFYHCDRCEYIHKVESRIEAHRRTHIQEDRKAQMVRERVVVVYK